MKNIKMSDIKFDLKNYPRETLNQEVVDDYVEAMKSGAIFPPIIVFEENKVFHLADGLHRYHAYLAQDRKRIPADVQKGSLHKAILCAAGANDKHGYRRTKEDKRKAVLTLIQNEEWQQKGINWIAKTCNVSWGLTDSVWSEYQDELHLPNCEDREEIEVERNGTVYKQTKAKKKDKKESNSSVQKVSELLTFADETRTLLASGDIESKKNAISSAEKAYAELHKLLGIVTGANIRIVNVANPLNVYYAERKDGIKKNEKFEEKGLCTYSVGIGFACGHQCTYCSTPAMLRTHGFFGGDQQTSYSPGHAIIDPNSVERIKSQIPAALTEEDVIQFSTIDDGWSPEARRLGLGGKIMRVLLEETPAQIRVLTKSAEVVHDFELFAEYPGRVIVGLSTGIPSDREDYAQIVEPNASPIAERLAALKLAHEMGLRTYGMLCPCLPLVADTKDALNKMFDEVLEYGVEDIWLEAVNARGKSLTNTEHALIRARLVEEAEAIHAIRTETVWSQYAYNLANNAISIAKKKKVLKKLKILQYSSSLTSEHIELLEKKGDSIIWL